MSNKLFVGGLAWATTDQSLEKAFAVHGEVTEARVVLDRDTGRSRGFGFVTFASSDSALAAKNAMDNAVIDGRNVRVDFATDRERGNTGLRRGSLLVRRSRGGLRAASLHFRDLWMPRQSIRTSLAAPDADALSHRTT